MMFPKTPPEEASVEDVEMGDIDDEALPKAAPVETESAHALVALVPFLDADPESNFTIVSGETDELVLRLSRSILNLAMLNALFTLVFRVPALIYFVMVESWVSVVIIALLVFLVLVSVFLGIQGVKTRNDTQQLCGAGFLTIFYRVYVILVVVGVIALLVGVAQGFFIVSVINFAFLCFYVRTAAQTRLLLDYLDGKRFALADVSLPNVAVPDQDHQTTNQLEDTPDDAVPAGPPPTTTAVAPTAATTAVPDAVVTHAD